MVVLQLLLVFAGFVLISLSAHQAVKHLVRLSRHFNVSEFVLSFLFVGIVSILPELTIGINSALGNAPAFGLGIVFGSNIADLTLVLGLVAFLSRGIRLRELDPAHFKGAIVSVALPVLLLIDGSISRFDGIVLIGAFIIYVAALISRRGKKSYAPMPTHEASVSPWKDGVLFIAAIALMFFSGNLITDSAMNLSALLGLPLFFIGILLAVGTCLPELAFAIDASRERHYDLGFGDILGNVFADCMATIGVIALIRPINPEFPGLALVSGILMIASMLTVMLVFGRKRSITKKDAVFLVLMFFFFIFLQLVAERAVVG